MDSEKKDFSNTCNKDDENFDNPCLNCIHFLFPVGCMINEDIIELRVQYLKEML